LSVVFGLVGLISLVLYLRDRKVKRASYSIRSWRLLDRRRQDLGGITLQYENEPVEDLCKTIVAFWNSGTATIEKSDIVDPIQIKVRDGLKLLKYDMLATGSRSNGILPSRQNGTIVISLEFLDRFEGLAIQLFHTGLTSQDVKVSSRIKGARLTRKDVEGLAVRLKLFLMIPVAIFVIAFTPKFPPVTWYGLLWDFALLVAGSAALVLGGAAIHRIILLRVAPKELLDIVSTPARIMIARRLDESIGLPREDE